MSQRSGAGRRVDRAGHALGLSLDYRDIEIQTLKLQLADRIAELKASPTVADNKEVRKRLEKKTTRVTELEHENARLREASAPAKERLAAIPRFLGTVK